MTKKKKTENKFEDFELENLETEKLETENGVELSYEEKIEEVEEKVDEVVEDTIEDGFDLMTDDSMEKILNVVFFFPSFSELRLESDKFLKDFYYFIEDLFGVSKNYKDFDKYLERISNNAIENLLDKFIAAK